MELIDYLLNMNKFSPDIRFFHMKLDNKRNKLAALSFKMKQQLLIERADQKNKV